MKESNRFLSIDAILSPFPSPLRLWTINIYRKSVERSIVASIPSIGNLIAARKNSTTDRYNVAMSRRQSLCRVAFLRVDEA